MTDILLIYDGNLPVNYELEIIQPQPNLDTDNRYYKAYPSIEYNIRLGVIGGSYPYTYALDTKPTGMVIDSVTGEISWPSPPASVTPYAVTASVTDLNNVTKNVSWDITVTESGFRFVDSVNGTAAASGGTGTFANPWKSIKDWYEGDDVAAVTKNSYSGEFLYYRSGTYLIDGYIDATTDDRFLCRDDNKPKVWLAYPGETPVIDFNTAYINYWEATNLYFDGFEFDINGNTRGMGVVIPGSNSNVTFRNNKFHGITNGSGGQNNALIFMTSGTAGKYWSIQDNEFYDVNVGYAILGYSAERVLVENNDHHDLYFGTGPKDGTVMWFIRQNTYASSTDAINVQNYASSIIPGEMEISFNYVAVDGGRVRINSNQTAVGLPFYIHRNTFTGSLVQVARPTSTNGEFYFYNNVIINEGTDPDKIQQINVEDATRVIITDDLTGNATDNIVDANGDLTEAYSSYLGTHGYQIN